MKNTEHFLIVAGAEAAAAEDAAQAAYVVPSANRPGSRDSGSLVRFQETAGRQWTAIEVVSSIYGWYLRYASGLDGFAVLARTTERGGSLDGSLINALIAARTYCAADPRWYAFIRLGYGLSDADRALLAEWEVR